MNKAFSLKEKQHELVTISLTLAGFISIINRRLLKKNKSVNKQCNFSVEL